jgi:hypothetical protein
MFQQTISFQPISVNTPYRSISQNDQETLHELIGENWTWGDHSPVAETLNSVKDWDSLVAYLYDPAYSLRPFIDTVLYVQLTVFVMNNYPTDSSFQNVLSMIPDDVYQIANSRITQNNNYDDDV